jgi:hypothetical protein
MVEIKLSSRQSPSAILAGVVVTSVDIKAREPHMAFRHSLVRDQQQYARHAHESSDNTYFFVINLHRQVAPTGEVEGAILLIDGSRNALV